MKATTKRAAASDPATKRDTEKDGEWEASDKDDTDGDAREEEVWSDYALDGGGKRLH